MYFANRVAYINLHLCTYLDYRQEFLVLISLFLGIFNIISYKFSKLKSSHDYLVVYLDQFIMTEFFSPLHLLKLLRVFILCFLEEGKWAVYVI